MSKLNRKFFLSLSVILIVVVILSVYLNKNFIHRYYLYQEKQNLNVISNQLITSKESLETIVQTIEEAEDVVIAWVESTDNNILLNERLRDAFLNKGISLQKYWLWEGDQQDTIKNGEKLRIYSQEKFHYSLMVNYMSYGEYFIAVGKIIPSINQSLVLMNKVTIFVFIGQAIVIFILIAILVHKIISPINAIGKTAKSIAQLDFKTVEVHTNDELEILANDINEMSIALQKSHTALEDKNRQMKELLSNVSHDLKTPVALIKAYVSGIQDGLDDGTFLDTIAAQNERMEDMIKQLLDLGRLQQMHTKEEWINCSDCIHEIINAYRLEKHMKQITFDCSIENDIIIMADKNNVHIIFSNLLSNAVKYTEDGVITLSLHKSGDSVLFDIKNLASALKNIDIQRLWEPFFVAEESRHKDQSGTGLGLAIVKAAADSSGYFFKSNLENDLIHFQVVFKV